MRTACGAGERPAWRPSERFWARPGTQAWRAAAIVGELLEAIERRVYRFEEIVARFCNRNAAQIVSEGHIHFGTPCHDLCTLAMARLRVCGFSPVAVLCRIARPWRPVKFQCGLELTLDGRAVYLGFGVSSNRMAPGRFVPTRRRTHVWRAPAQAAELGAPLLAHFGIADLEQLERLVAGHRLELHLRSYRWSARVRAHARALRRARRKRVRDRTGELFCLGRWAALRADGSCAR